MRKFIIGVLLALIPFISYGADTKLQDLTEEIAIAGDDQFYMIDTSDSNADNRISATNIFDLINTEAKLETISTITNIIRESEIDTSAELIAILGDETGTGALVFATSPVLVTPTLGTINSGVGTSLTALNGENIQDDTIDDDSIDFADVTLLDFGLAITHDTAAELDALYEAELNNSAGLLDALSDETGTGLAVFSTAPSFTTSITSTLVLLDLLDTVGAADMDYGSADVTDHTFTTDSTGTAEIVLPAGSIDGTEILDDTIDSADYAAGSIDAEHLAADIIDETKLADNSIDSEHYNDGSIDAIHLAADIIDETKIADNGIDSEHYNDGSIDAIHIAADVITHTQILDADQADTKCIWFEDPTADDDFKSIWANKTANDFLLTEIWAESDQTVTFNLQVDDGTPANVNGASLAPAAGEVEDTSLEGDTTVAAGEELDLVIDSVGSAPTWVSICFTGNWVD